MNLSSMITPAKTARLTRLLYGTSGPVLGRVLRRLKRNEKGAILAEIALALPVFISLLTGIVEVGNYLLVNLKLQHTVVSIADLVTRDESITQDLLDDIFLAAPQIMAPFPMGEDAVVVVSAISQNADTPMTIFWQRSGGGTLNQNSEFGIEGEVPSLPDGLTLRDDETILATEIYFAYEPIIFDFLPAQVIRKSSFFRPRIGALQAIE